MYKISLQMSHVEVSVYVTGEEVEPPAPRVEDLEHQRSEMIDPAAAVAAAAEEASRVSQLAAPSPSAYGTPQPSPASLEHQSPSCKPHEDHNHSHCSCPALDAREINARIEQLSR